MGKPQNHHTLKAPTYLVVGAHVPLFLRLPGRVLPPFIFTVDKTQPIAYNTQ
jgi:hypothetical protein